MSPEAPEIATRWLIPSPNHTGMRTPDVRSRPLDTDASGHNPDMSEQ